MYVNHGLFRKRPPDGQPPSAEDTGLFRYGIRSIFSGLALGAFLPNPDRMRAADLDYHFTRVCERFVFSLQELSFSMRQMSALFSRPMVLDFPSLTLRAGMQAEYAMNCLGTLVDDIAVAIVLATGLRTGQTAWAV